MTVGANGAFRDIAMLLRRLLMNAMARKARNVFLAEQYHVANVFLHMSICRIQSRYGLWRQINLKIAKQIIAGDKIIRIRQSRGFRVARSHVALGAD
jgi:hypothetical protein